MINRENANSLIKFASSSKLPGSIGGLIGLVVNDFEIRLQGTTNILKLQNSSAADFFTFNSATNNSIFVDNLSVNGTFQSPLTSLLAVSTAQAVTRNETTLPTTSNNFGTTGTDRTMNSNSNLLLNCNSANSYIQFRGNTQGASNGLIDVLTNDFIVRLPSLTRMYYLQDSTAVNRWS